MGDSKNQHAAEVQPTAERRWPRRLRRMAVLYVVVPYLAVVLVFVLLQRKFIYRPTVAEDLSAQSNGFTADRVNDLQIQTPDGDTLRGWLLRADRDGESRPPLMLYFPGNSLNRAERITDLREMSRRGFDVVIFDYRGFGDSSGSPSETTLTGDARLIWDFARQELDYAEEEIVIFGESLGGAVALSLWSVDRSEQPQPAALILNSTFASLPQTVGWHYPLFPFQFLLLDRWPSIDRIGAVRAPKLIFHNTGDEVVPLEQGRRLAGAAEDVHFFELNGDMHNEIPPMLLREQLEQLHESILLRRSETTED